MPDHPFHVAYLSYDGLTDPLGQSQILPYVLGLEKNGFQFTIFSFEKPDAFVAGRSLIDTAIAGKKIVWIPLRYHKKPPVFSTLLDIFILKRAVLKVHSEKPFDLIHCRSYITSLVGLRIKRKTGIKFLFDMRGFWADERVEGGLWNLKNPIYRVIYNFFKQKERQFLKEADHIISLTENAKYEIISWNLKQSPITVIPTCVDLDHFNPNKIKRKDQVALRAKLGINQTDFVLIYLGSWGTWYLTNEMLQFFSILRNSIENSRFLILTNDNVNVSDYNYKQDIVVTVASRQLVPLYISIADLSVCFIKPTFSKRASSATKVGELLAMGKWVISNNGWGDPLKSAKAFTLDNFSELQMNSGLAWVLERKKSETLKTDIQHLALRTGIDNYSNIYGLLLNEPTTAKVDVG